MCSSDLFPSHDILVIAGFYVTGIGLGAVLGPKVFCFEKTVCYADCAAGMCYGFGVFVI